MTLNKASEGYVFGHVLTSTKTPDLLYLTMGSSSDGTYLEKGNELDQYVRTTTTLIALVSSHTVYSWQKSQILHRRYIQLFIQFILQQKNVRLTMTIIRKAS